MKTPVLPLMLLAPALLGGRQFLALTAAGVGASTGISHMFVTSRPTPRLHG